MQSEEQRRDCRKRPLAPQRLHNEVEQSAIRQMNCQRHRVPRQRIGVEKAAEQAEIDVTEGTERTIAAGRMEKGEQARRLERGARGEDVIVAEKGIVQVRRDRRAQ